jgi:energy-coupling factor transporter ATP-binding protein EcfA2
MALQRILIENYRSISNLDISFGPLNAFIGPNNSGKSNLLRALNLVLGETWPSRPLATKDFFQNNIANRVTVEVFFAQPLICDPSVSGFSLCCYAGQAPEYFAIDDAGNPCYWPNGSQKRVSNAMRSEVALLHLDLDRTADRQLRATQWTLYGKLLGRIEASLDPANRLAFRNAVTNAVNRELRGSLNTAQGIIHDFVRRQTGLDVSLEFEALDPIEVLKGVRPYIHDGPMISDAEEVGAGVQSALAVGIAKAYAEIVRQPLILAIEEPELYLHPHGCRNFYKLLMELSEQGLQIIYTTHERSFVNAGEYDALHIVRKAGGGTNVTSGSLLQFGGQRDRLRLQSKFNERINEVFFANAVVLVEGDPDEIACRCALTREGLDLDRQSISVVSVGGINEILLIAQLLHGLHIPTFALVDEDPGNAVTQQTIADISALLGAGCVSLQTPNLEGLFALASKPSRVSSMTLFPRWFAAPGNVTPPVYVNLANLIRALR